MKTISGLVFGVIGSSLNILFALFLGVVELLLGSVMGDEEFIGEISGLAGLGGQVMLIVFVILAFYLVTGILGLIFSLKMRRDDVGVGAGVWCLILGLVSLNILLVVSGILGIVFLGRDPQYLNN